MRFRSSMVVPIQALCGGSCLILGLWIGMPGLDLAVLEFLFLVAMAVALVRRSGVSHWGLLIAWSISIFGLARVLVTRSAVYAWDDYFSIPPFLLAGAIWLASIGIAEKGLEQKWRMLAMLWLLLATLIWLAAAYLENLRPAFHVGLVILVAVLVLLKRWFALPWSGVQVLNTLILLAIALPVADWILRPRFNFDPEPDPSKKAYLYANAMRDPGAYAAWRQYALVESTKSMERYYVPDPSGAQPFRLRPGAHGPFFKSTMQINSLGFRGDEIPAEKGDAYRIVALGESTTFGYTYAPGDEPWPQVLERLIHERLKLRRPVIVINAGVPGYTIQNNLRRLPTDILPLKPDMIISYHGINGFPLILPSLPPVLVKDAPAYRERPLALLAECEFKIRILLFKYRQMKALRHSPPVLPAPLQTEYARAYEQLIDLAKTNDIRLVLSTFSMAVNSQSDANLVDFYRGTHLAVYWQIKANAIHSEIVRQLAKQHTDVCLVDTQPNLDGKHDAFTDLVHLTQEGRQELAETFFAAIRPMLEKELAAETAGRAAER